MLYLWMSLEKLRLMMGVLVVKLDARLAASCRHGQHRARAVSLNGIEGAGTLTFTAVRAVCGHLKEASRRCGRPRMLTCLQQDT